MEQQGFKPEEVKGGSGYRPKEEGAEDNPLIVVGVHTKDIAYGRYPRMPTTSWAERAYSSGALDPSLGQAFAFPSCCNCGCALKSPFGETWQHPQSTCQQKTLPQKTPGRQNGRTRLALPVPVGMVETQADETDEAAEDEAMNVEPSFAFAKGHGRFGIDLRAKNCHVPHRVEPDIYPFQLDQGP